MSSTGAAASVGNAFRVVAAALLAVRVMLAIPHLRIASLQAIAPVQDHFFPAALRHPALLLVAFFAPVISEVMALAQAAPGRMKLAAVVETFGAGLLLLHQASYFYATWVIVFWAGLFMVWMAWSGAADEERASAIGPFLAQLIIAFLFLGGAAGKWTAGYWSGEIFYDLFFAHRTDLIYSQMRLWFGDATVHLIATWFSRTAVVVETSMALVVFLPTRLASSVSIAAALGLWFTSSDLFEVSWPIIGLACAGRLLAAARRRPDGCEGRRLAGGNDKTSDAQAPGIDVSRPRS